MQKYILLLTFTATIFNTYSMELTPSCNNAVHICIENEEIEEPLNNTLNTIEQRYHFDPNAFKEMWAPISLDSSLSSNEKILVLQKALETVQIWGKRFCNSCKNYQDAIDVRDRMSAYDAQDNDKLRQEIKRLKDLLSQNNINDPHIKAVVEIRNKTS